ncbi:archaemetzincin [Candidatus Uabimicrobium amorphum]|uniref:Zn-dependent protease n=1 Tax=Uabimicrobium amorphum TaxID=2596890 RepID=A0A5S9F5C4_UABAM|nr:archaemetzincin [Candidatus Uabimicrobium amorphum]BBM86707.1 hypothetical protein UABAM_05094 [Candidatus Uabimicrobium amorphum]
MKTYVFTIVVLSLLTLACSQENKLPSQKQYYKDVSSLDEKLQRHHFRAVDELQKPFLSLIEKHKIFHPGGMHDWYPSHKEPGQTFFQYKKRQKNSKLTTIYIQKLGDFSQEQKQVVALVTRYISSYFQVPVKFTKPIPLSKIPRSARRIHPSWGDKQILTTYILRKVLYPNRPKDAIAYIALTGTDLYPRESWNFVYGQASLTHRVGVFSMYRNGDPSSSKELFLRCFLRTAKTATHEIGHMLGMKHCIAFACCMNGSNNREESDRGPLWLCPVCLCKLQWFLPVDLQKRYDELAAIVQSLGFHTRAQFFRDSITLIDKK